MRICFGISTLGFRTVAVDESVQKLGRCISLGIPILIHDSSVCSVRWPAPACRRWPNAFAVTRVGNFKRQNAMGREFPVQHCDSDLCHAVLPAVGLWPSVVCRRAPFPCHIPAPNCGTCAPRLHFPWPAVFPPPPPLLQEFHLQPCSTASQVLRSSPTSCARGSSSYTFRLHDAHCTRRFPAGCSRARDLPVPV
jgi:hypothetical protein